MKIMVVISVVTIMAGLFVLINDGDLHYNKYHLQLKNEVNMNKVFDHEQ